VEISGKTKIYGIIGCPVEHSLSPVFQAYFAEKHDINAVYVPYHVKAGGVPHALTGLAAAGVQGLNITVPYKEEVLAYVQADAAVGCIGAANTLTWHDAWYASNTDWQGVAAVLQGMGLETQQGVKLLLFGAGGTARAVLHAAQHLGITKIMICNRSEERLNKLLEHAAVQYPDLQCEAVAWQQDAVLKASDEAVIVVNTTSIGLADDQSFPFELAGQGWAMDAVYKPSGITAFTQVANACDRQVVDGLPMLIAQGVKSFEGWHPDVTTDMLDALIWMENKLGRKRIRLPSWEGSR